VAGAQTQPKKVEESKKKVKGEQPSISDFFVIKPKA